MLVVLEEILFYDHSYRSDFLKQFFLKEIILFLVHLWNFACVHLDFIKGVTLASYNNVTKRLFEFFPPQLLHVK